MINGEQGPLPSYIRQQGRLHVLTPLPHPIANQFLRVIIRAKWNSSQPIISLTTNVSNLPWSRWRQDLFSRVVSCSELHFWSCSCDLERVLWQSSSLLLRFCICICHGMDDWKYRNVAFAGSSWSSWINASLKQASLIQASLIHPSWIHASWIHVLWIQASWIHTSYYTAN